MVQFSPTIQSLMYNFCCCTLLIIKLLSLCAHVFCSLFTRQEVEYICKYLTSDIPLKYSHQYQDLVGPVSSVWFLVTWDDVEELTSPMIAGLVIMWLDD